MRLTLRTLLAYSDDILDPADHEELSKKIEASDFASELIHRTRDTVRRLRLGAPEVLADGGDGVLDTVSVSDANAVAEYLDNTLAPEDIADFERMCLEPGNEADMHLAEVASCHHVLTMVLGEPAEIDAVVRQRMYDLPGKLASGQKLRAEPAHVGAPPEAPAVEMPAVVQRAAAVEPEVPDYLREAARANNRGKRFALAAVLLFVVAGVGWFIFSPVEQQSAPSGVATADLEEAFGDLGIEGSAVETEGVSGDAVDTGGTAPPFDPGMVATEEEAVESPTPLAEDIELIEEVPLSEIPTTPLLDSVGGVESPESIAEAGSDAAKATADATPSPEITEFPDTTEPLSPTEEVEMALEDVVELDGEPVLIASKDGAPGETPISPLEPEVEAAGPVQLGSYLGNGDMLLRHDGESNRWVRLPPRSALSTGDRLLALPTFRTHVVLSDVNTYLSGGTQLVLVGNGEVDVDGEVDLNLNVTYGEILLNAGLDGSRIALSVGNEWRRFLLSGSASLAIEVRRLFVPGSDNEHQLSPVEVVWYLTSGSVDWPGESGEMQTIEAPATWKTIDGSDDSPQVLGDLPRWIDREPMTDMQQRAHSELEKELGLDVPVRLRLIELSDQEARGRKREVRTLAAEASVHIGEFEPFVKSLSDKDQNRAWGSHIETLRQALALSPDAAAGVREAFVNLRGEQAGGDLMEMVAGYNQEQIGQTRDELAVGAMVRLIRWLESDNLDYRVLAIQNLDEIMGIKGGASWKGFRPEGPPQRRKIVIAKIWESFESKDLLPVLKGK